MSYFIYVALSECKTITKVGMSNNPSTRVSNLKTFEGATMKALFVSVAGTKQQALDIELAVNKKFNKDIINGNEWYSTKPILIIEYLIEELNLEPYKIDVGETTYPSWECNTQSYFAGKDLQDYPFAKVQPNKGIYSVSFLFGDEFRYLSFCNFGDFRTFYSANKLFITSPEELRGDLYNLYRGNPLNIIMSSKKDVYGLRKILVGIKLDVEKLI